jgi:outer membrane immunogenic protein
VKKFLTAALLASAATSAMASDLPPRGYAPPPAYAPLPFTWTGAYVGANAGYGWGESPGAGKVSFANVSSGFVGGTAGVNYQIGHLVLGAEGDFDFSDMSNTNVQGKNWTKAYVSSFGTARARAGFALDRTLFYVTGGFAGAEVRGTFDNTAKGVVSTQSGFRTGGVIGGGIEYAVTNNISLKGEYLYAPLGAKTYFAGTAASFKTGLDLSILRAGVNYKF